jgi:hypothetical protein
MNNNRRLVALLSLLFTQTTFAGQVVIPPQAAAVPVDSPWVISGLTLTLAVIGVRLLQNWRK